MIAAVVYAVTRRGPDGFVKCYPPFADRGVAEYVAQLASEKHRGHVVTLEPVSAKPLRRLQKRAA